MLNIKNYATFDKLKVVLYSFMKFEKTKFPVIFYFYMVLVEFSENNIIATKYIKKKYYSKHLNLWYLFIRRRKQSNKK